MVNKHLTYLILSSILLLVVVTSCNNNTKGKIERSDYEKLEMYFNEIHKFKFNTEVNQIIVLTEKGCPSCNEHFLRFTVNFLNNPNSVIIVASDGTGLDISTLLYTEGNIFFDSNINHDKVNLLDSTRVIFLKSKDIDTVITINAFEIEEQFDFILNKTEDATQ